MSHSEVSKGHEKADSSRDDRATHAAEQPAPGRSSATEAATSRQFAASKPIPSGRVFSIDAYRGFVMLLMMAEVLRLSRVAREFPESRVWEWLAFHQSHVPWRGCSLHDLIQPSFSFLVGVALPYSMARRTETGQSRAWLVVHAGWRAMVLIGLGIFLRSVGQSQTNFTFVDTLTQIGLGYVPLFLLGFARTRWHWVALIVILVGYWGAFVAYPLPSDDFDYAAVGVPDDWPHHEEGLAAHFNMNSNLAWAFDTWFLNLFPRETPFTYQGGGYATLNFIPTLGTMILGLIAGTWLRNRRGDWTLLGTWLATAAMLFLLGWGLDASGICPSVKRIWTPAWTLLSGGWCFLLLAGFFLVIDVWKWQAWSFPLRVIGMNSIAAYCMAHLLDSFILDSFRTHFGSDIFRLLGDEYASLLSGTLILAVYGAILYWMYHRRLFLKI